MIETAIRGAAAAGLGGMAVLLGGLFGVGGGFLVIPLQGFSMAWISKPRRVPR
jgi:hypothetical protein